MKKTYPILLFIIQFLSQVQNSFENSVKFTGDLKIAKHSNSSLMVSKDLEQ